MQRHDVEVAKITDSNTELGQHGIAISAEGCRWRVARGSISFSTLPLLRVDAVQKRRRPQHAGRWKGSIGALMIENLSFDWGRYGELFDLDTNSGQLALDHTRTPAQN
jgi:hypothetical protein